MLTYRCNLACEYCFANEFVNAEDSNISFENYTIAKEFLLSSGDGNIGLIGGEPTIYPNLDKVLEDLNDDERVTTVTIYTNGLEIDKYIDKISNEKFNFLINCNGKNNIGVRYSDLEKNVKRLYQLRNAKKRVTLGINLYKNDMDYQFVLKLARENDVHRLRMSLTVPNLEKTRRIDAREYFLSRKESLFGFLHECDENLIVPYFDCNMAPYCIWTEEEYEWIKSYLKKYRVKRTNLLGTECICRPVIDILPDLHCVRCFGLSDITKAKISEFRNLEDLYRYYEGVLDSFVYHMCGDDKCLECYEKKVGKCFSGCLAFYANKLKQAKVIALP